jgi:hypothetical protein
MSDRESLGNAAAEAARLLDAVGEWLAARAAGGEADRAGAAWADHIATGAAECQICPLCRLIVAARAAGPELADRLDDLVRALAGVLRAAGDAMGAPDPPGDGSGRGFQTIVIN